MLDHRWRATTTTTMPSTAAACAACAAAVFGWRADRDEEAAHKI
jgi:hypothetical protein